MAVSKYKWNHLPNFNNEELSMFNSMASDYKKSKYNPRPDAFFIDLGYIEWIKETINILSCDLTNWKDLSSRIPEVFLLCSGLGLFRSSSNALLSSTEGQLEQLLSEDHTSTIYMSYYRCLQDYKGRYSVQHGGILPFSWYMERSIYQKLGRILYRMLPKKTFNLPGNCYYEEFDLTDNYLPYKNIPYSKIAEIIGVTTRAVEMMLAPGKELRKKLANLSYIRVNA